MAVTPTSSPLVAIAGIRLGTAAAGIRKGGRDDLVVIECSAGTQGAALFTRNRFCAAPVQIARAHLAARPPRALLINAGNANAGTGAAGVEAALLCCAGLAKELHCAATEVLPFSTGVIGEPLPHARVISALPGCIANLSESGWAAAAQAIMTTDTVPKASSRRVRIADREVAITGIAKGAGMICPNMATMLAFIATDAAVAQNVLQRCLQRAVDASFNRITVDGDTSTNDACVLLATGRAGHQAIASDRGADYETLAQAIHELCNELAQAIVRDAEGATKYMLITVEEGASEDDCLAVAYTIAHSPLVKTAFFASDPNWGRIFAAIGRAPIPKLTVNAVCLYLNQVCVVRNGAVAADYTEALGREAMRASEIHVRVTLGAGKHAAQIATCDLSHDYVRINAEYRT